MPKGYWVTIYRKIHDPAKLAAYAELAPKATAPFGGKYLARGTAANAYEAGLKDRIVISEFPTSKTTIIVRSPARGIRSGTQPRNLPAPPAARPRV